MLEAEDLVVVREGGRRTLDGVSLRLAPGETVALEGPSGAGKSTLLWALARLLPRESGTLSLDGVGAEGVPVRTWRRRVGLAIQKPVLFPGTVAENLTWSWRLGGRDGDEPASTLPPDETLRRELDLVGLDDVECARPAEELSVGQATRVCVLRTLLSDPAYLLLDEPAAALDDRSAGLLARRLDAFVAAGGGVLLVRHGGLDGSVTRRIALADGNLGEVRP